MRIKQFVDPQSNKAFILNFSPHNKAPTERISNGVDVDSDA